MYIYIYIYIHLYFLQISKTAFFSLVQTERDSEGFNLDFLVSKQAADTYSFQFLDLNDNQN